MQNSVVKVAAWSSLLRTRFCT